MRRVISTQTAKYDSNSANKKIMTSRKPCCNYVISACAWPIRWFCPPDVQRTLWNVSVAIKHSDVSLSFSYRLKIREYFSLGRSTVVGKSCILQCH